MMTANDAYTSESQPHKAKRTVEPSAGLSGRLLFPLVFGFVLVPLVIVLHECGHFAAMALQGQHPHLTAIGVYTISATREAMMPSRRILSEAAGPLVEALCCLGGLAWLKARRKNRLESEPTALDWVATVLASMSARWIAAPAFMLWAALRGGGPYGDDESRISLQMGLPGWTLPVALWLVALWLFFAMVFLHPRGSRLLPFTVLGIAGTAGACLWAFEVGPALFSPPPY